MALSVKYTLDAQSPIHPKLQTVYVGDTIQIYCIIENAVWDKDGGRLPHQSTVSGNVLTLVNVTFQYTGIYTCIKLGIDSAGAVVVEQKLSAIVYVGGEINKLKYYELLQFDIETLLFRSTLVVNS